MTTFTAALRNFENKTVDRMVQVLKASLQDTMRIAQTPVAQGGPMPVDLSFLRNSLVSQLDGTAVARGQDSYTLAIAGLEVGQEIRFSWVAVYSRRVHYGFKGTDSLGRTYNQDGQPFRDFAAAQWQRMVAANARRL